MRFAFCVLVPDVQRGQSREHKNRRIHHGDGRGAREFRHYLVGAILSASPRMVDGQQLYGYVDVSVQRGGAYHPPPSPPRHGRDEEDLRVFRVPFGFRAAARKRKNQGKKKEKKKNKKKEKEAAFLRQQVLFLRNAFVKHFDYKTKQQESLSFVRRANDRGTDGR